MSDDPFEGIDSSDVINLTDETFGTVPHAVYFVRIFVLIKRGNFLCPLSDGTLYLLGSVVHGDGAVLVDFYAPYVQKKKKGI